ncbi:MAG: acyl-CoA carboxylase subunit beta [Acidimicrobiia bacterium]
MPNLALRARTPGAVTTEIVELDGRQVVLAVVDGADRKGALSSVASDKLADAARAARAGKLPFIGVIASSGADIVEGMSALHGWGTAAKALSDCSGVVPTILVVDGPAVSGPALLLGIADLVIMTEAAYAFVSGPTMVAEFTGIVMDNAELGGAASHARFSGVAAMVAADRDAAMAIVSQLLAFLPQHCDELPPMWPTDDPWDRSVPEAGAIMPATATGSYDVRAIISAIVDDGEFIEIRARWAPNVVIGFASIDGQSVGIVADQPIAIAGTLDIPSSQKAARFVAMCDAFNLPIITLVDTPGFYPGKDLEWRGMIRHGAQLVFAYARASVPRVCVVLRKSYGGAYIVMDSKRMGNDLCLAWPGAELAVMGAKGATEILHRRATPEERVAREAEYEAKLLNPYIAAERGYVDGVIDPADTRREIAAALRSHDSKRERFRGRKHDNTPL